MNAFFEYFAQSARLGVRRRQTTVRSRIDWPYQVKKRRDCNRCLQADRVAGGATRRAFGLLIQNGWLVDGLLLLLTANLVLSRVSRDVYTHSGLAVSPCMQARAATPTMLTPITELGDFVR